MQEERRVVRRFLARADNAEVFTIIEWVNEKTFAPLTGSRRTYEKSREWTLADGTSGVTKFDTKTFKIVQTDVVVREIN
jgi:hypothetical protein